MTHLAAPQAPQWLWRRDRPVIVTRAPGRLDVMGGIADYCGSLVAEMPLAVAATVGVQARHDDRIRCRSVQVEGQPVGVAWRELAPLSAEQLRQRLSGDDRWAGYVLGCAWWLGRHRNVAGPGLDLLLDSAVPLGGGVSSSAAIEVAAMLAIAAAADVTLTPMELAAACQQVENLVVGAPCGVMDQVTSAMGQQGRILKLLCQPDGAGMPAQVLGFTAVPRGVTFTGIHSGVRHEVSGDPYTDTRVAAFMAQRILAAATSADVPDRWLANIDADTFTARLAALLPEQMTGDAFLAQYHGTEDSVTTVRPERTYHVRAAARHHVLESRRVQQFVALLEDDRADLHERMIAAGRLMIASHHSYGQCARLGHPLTDRLVEMVEEEGPSGGLYGAKITGGGCGGTVAVLIRDDAAARRRLDDIVRRYEQDTGRTTMRFAGSSPGACVTGVHRQGGKS